MKLNDLHLWYSEHSFSGLSENTRKAYHSRYQLDIRPVMGHMDISTISTPFVKAFYKNLLEVKTLANATANITLSYLKMLFLAAEERGLVQTSPVNIKMKRGEVRDRFASSTEIKQLVNHFDSCIEEGGRNVVAAIFFKMLLLTGARPSSLINATQDQITEIDHDGQTYGILSAKGKKFNKTIEKDFIIIPPEIYKVWKLTLQNPEKMPEGYNKRYEKIKKKCRNKPLPMFPIASVLCVVAAFPVMCEKIGIKNLQLRDLRRTYATLGFGEGVGIGIIGELLNHKSTETTKIYARLDFGPRINAIKKISDKIKSYETI